MTKTTQCASYKSCTRQIIIIKKIHLLKDDHFISISHQHLFTKNFLFALILSLFSFTYLFRSFKLFLLLLHQLFFDSRLFLQCATPYCVIYKCQQTRHCNNQKGSHASLIQKKKKNYFQKGKCFSLNGAIPSEIF